MYNLIDYKGKYTVIQDNDIKYDCDIIDGEITHEQAIEQAKQRKEACLYYGIPAYIGSNKELRKIYKI